MRAGGSALRVFIRVGLARNALFCPLPRPRPTIAAFGAAPVSTLTFVGVSWLANYLAGLSIINSTGTAIRVQSWRTVAGLGRTGERRVRGGPYTTHVAGVRGRVTKIARSARGSARLAQAQFAGAVLGLVGARLLCWARLNTRVTGP